MKKIFLFAVAAMVSLNSCVQSEEVYTGKVNEIGFKSAAVRGIIDTNADFKYPIAVSAIWDNPNDASDKYVVRFDQAKFVYDEDNSSWRGETPYYWPSRGEYSGEVRVWFVANRLDSHSNRECKVFARGLSC